MKGLMKRWGLTSNWQVVVVCVIFALTGSTAAKIAGPMTEALGLTIELGAGLYWTIRILIIFPAYQVLLVFFGWLFGEFTFFWNFEKKMLRNLGLGFLLK
jgi:hypothetical protein